MKIYHYTKGTSINSIFTDGFIATESKRGISNTPRTTDCVWLTEKKQFPKTALPFINFMPETNLMAHIGKKAVFVDLDKVSSFVGGIYRFSFDSTEQQFKRWKFCDERKALMNDMFWRSMEQLANKVGDEVQAFWISTTDLKLENFSLERFENGYWNAVLKDVSLSNLSADDRAIVIDLAETSKKTCVKLGLPLHHVKLAA